MKKKEMYNLTKKKSYEKKCLKGTLKCMQQSAGKCKLNPQ